MIRATYTLKNSGVGAAREVDSIRYLFSVTGNKGKGNVVVIVNIGEDDSVGSIEIEVFKN